MCESCGRVRVAAVASPARLIWSSCFSYIFLRLMHWSASRFFPAAENFFALVISLSILRPMWVSRFSIVSIMSRTFVIAPCAFAAASCVVLGAGGGATANKRAAR